MALEDSSTGRLLYIDIQISTVPCVHQPWSVGEPHSTRAEVDVIRRPPPRPPLLSEDSKGSQGAEVDSPSKL